MAIDHLEHDRKRELYAEVFALLEPGGVFANFKAADALAGVTLLLRRERLTLETRDRRGRQSMGSSRFRDLLRITSGGNCPGRLSSSWR